MKSDELKPVPCGCGGEADIIKHEFFECSPCYGVRCKNCGTASYQGFDTEAEAVEAWNRAMGRKTGEWAVVPNRELEHGEVVTNGEAVRCSECRHADKDWNENMKFCPNCGADMRGEHE